MMGDNCNQKASQGNLFMFCSCNTISENETMLDEDVVKKAAFKNPGSLILIKATLVQFLGSSSSWALCLWANYLFIYLFIGGGIKDKI